jgi:hypothetical protein
MLEAVMIYIGLGFAASVTCSLLVSAIEFPGRTYRMPLGPVAPKPTREGMSER